jgi:fucose permease
MYWYSVLSSSQYHSLALTTKLEKAGAALAELVILPWGFWLEDAQGYRGPEASREGDEIPIKPSTNIFSYRATWICAAYLLVYVGTEAAISGWIVSFMIRARHASPYLASIYSSGFWVGMAVGRFLLGGITDRIGVRRTTAAYLACAIILQLLFVVVDSLTGSGVLITMIGFLCGPLFPSCIVQLAHLLPREVYVAAVSSVASVGQVGAALLPFGLGALSQWLGIEVFGSIITTQFMICLLLWMLIPRPISTHEVDDVEERVDTNNPVEE